MTRRQMLRITVILVVLQWAGAVGAQDVLPFPEPPMGGKVGPTMQESVHKWRQPQRHLPEDAPNILIVMLDDAGFGHAGTFGGDIATPASARTRGMKLNEEGDIEIYVAAERPEGVPEENWLPINRKDEKIDLIMRIYVPDLAKLKSWRAPKAEKVAGE